VRRRVAGLGLAALLAGCSAAETADPTPAAAGPDVSTAAQRYIDAVNDEDLEALVAAFTADGTVVDVSREIVGAEAIGTWAEREVIGGTLRVDGVTDLDEETQRLRVHWAPRGSDGWAADYTFTSQDDLVLRADLQYAP
jgi:ABC-type glycerol-3-phosphate transport system substrate-binding protein